MKCELCGKELSLSDPNAMFYQREESSYEFNPKPMAGAHNRCVIEALKTTK